MDRRNDKKDGKKEKRKIGRTERRKDRMTDLSFSIMKVNNFCVDHIYLSHSIKETLKKVFNREYDSRKKLRTLAVLGN